MGKKKVLVTGASGFVGGHIARGLARSGWAVYAVGGSRPCSEEVQKVAVECQQLDICEQEQVSALLERVKPDLIVHAAALARIGECEENPEEAHQLNFKSASNLASAVISSAAEQSLTEFIYLSTDLVFDGDYEAPKGGFLEDSAPNPKSVYAKTKLDGERAVLSKLRHALVFRLALVYGAPIGGKEGFMAWLRSRLEEGRELPMFTDEWRTPVFVDDIVKAIDAAAKKLSAGKLSVAEKSTDRIFHIAGNERLSRYEFGLKVAEVLQYDPSCIVASMQRNVASAAPRARDASLCNKKAQDLLGIKFSSVRDGLKRIAKVSPRKNKKAAIVKPKTPYSPRTILFYIFYIILFTVASVGSAYRLAEPAWESGHHSFEMGNYPHYAKNLLRYGLLETKLGMVLDYSNCLSDGFNYRVDYGFVSSLLIAASYKLFGVSDMSARLAPLSLTILCLLAVFGLCWALTKNRAFGLLAALLCVLSPWFIYYARLPGPHAMATAFFVLCALFYWRWFETRKKGFLTAFILCGFLGAQTEWVVYFVFPFLLLHYFFYERSDRSKGIISLLLLAPFVFFGIHLFWACLLAGPEGLETLWSKFLGRTNIQPHSASTDVSFAQLMSIFKERSVSWFPYSVLTISILWLGTVLYRIARWRLPVREGFLLAILCAGLAYVFAFPNLSYHHDFCMMHHLVPILAVICVYAFAIFVRRYLIAEPIVLAALLMIPMYDYLLAGVPYWTMYDLPHRQSAAQPELYYLGEKINKSVSQCGKYIDTVNLQTPAQRAIADRMRVIPATVVDLSSAIDDKQNELVLVANDAKIRPEVIKNLIENYQHEEIYGYSLFYLKRNQSNVLIEQPANNQGKTKSFGSISHLGSSVFPKIVASLNEPSFLERYLNRNYHLLPEYRRTVLIDNYWRKNKKDSINFRLKTALVYLGDRDYQITRSYPSLYSLYPTALWPAGKTIHEQFYLEIPPDAPRGEYALRVGAESDVKTAEMITVGRVSIN